MDIHAQKLFDNCWSLISKHIISIQILNIIKNKK